MMLACIRVRNEFVRELAAVVDEPTATVVRNAVEREVVIVASSIDDRGRILRALDDPRRGQRRPAPRARVGAHENVLCES